MPALLKLVGFVAAHTFSEVVSELAAGDACCLDTGIELGVDLSWFPFFPQVDDLSAYTADDDKSLLNNVKSFFFLVSGKE
jgi:hypothetical protein